MYWLDAIDLEHTEGLVIGYGNLDDEVIDEAAALLGRAVDGAAA